MIEVDKEVLRKEHKINTLFQSIFANTLSYNFEFTQAECKRMMLDSDIKTHIDRIKLAVNSRIPQIQSEGKYKDFLQNQFDDIQSRNVISVIIDSQYYGYSVQEVIYNDDLTIKELKEKPNEWYLQQYNSTLEKWEWRLTYTGLNLGGERLPDLKYLIPINRPTDIFRSGRSELEPIYKYWKIKDDSLTFARQIVEKYGGIITWFLYEAGTTDADYSEMVTRVGALGNQSVIGLEKNPNVEARGLNHDFGFIPLHELTSDVQINLVKFCLDRISQYFIGSSITLNAGESGSYSSANVGIEMLDDVIESDVAYCEHWLDWLIYYQSVIFGFDYKEYHLKLIKKDNPKENEALNNAKLTNYKMVKELGYNLTAEYISEQLGIPIEALEVAQVQALQFEKKDIDDLKAEDRRIDTELQKVFEKLTPRVTGQIADQYVEAYKKAKTKADFDNISTDFSATELDEYLLIFQLFGMYTQQYRGALEFAEIDVATVEEIFDLPFAEAVTFFTNKMPQLFDNIDEMTADNITKTFWIKKATDIEVTKKVKAALDKHLELGGTFKSFSEDIKNNLDKVGVSTNGYYLKTVFQNANLGSYNAGRYEMQEQTKDIFEYGLYNGIDDSKQSKICRDLDGQIFRMDDPIWQTIHPQNHHGCRSVRTALTREQVEEYGLKLGNNMAKVNESVNAIIKNGFVGLPTNQTERLKQIALSKGATI